MTSRWDRPKPRVYEYNYKIQSDYYRPTVANLDTGKKDPQAKSFAERDTSAALQEAKAKLQEMEERQFPQRQPLWQKHPYYVPEESIVVPPHESSIWPESRPHFHLVSSYDLMVGYLGIRGMGEREAERQRRRDAQQ